MVSTLNQHYAPTPPHVRAVSVSAGWSICGFILVLFVAVAMRAE